MFIQIMTGGSWRWEVDDRAGVNVSIGGEGEVRATSFSNGLLRLTNLSITNKSINLQPPTYFNGTGGGVDLCL